MSALPGRLRITLQSCSVNSRSVYGNTALVKNLLRLKRSITKKVKDISNDPDRKSRAKRMRDLLNS